MNASDVDSPLPGCQATAAETPGLDPREFPSATEDQREEARRSFIASIEPDAVCALASKFRDGRSCRVVGKDSGSFNLCFFVAFDQDEPEWVVRVPLEDGRVDLWDKLLSEVSTLRYLKRNTAIPLPLVHAYGRDVALTKTGTGTQMFIITDFIPGRPLKLSSEASEEHRRNLFSGLIDVLAELRRLEFPLIGSLMPDPNGSPDPVLGPVMSMSATTLRLPPRRPFTSAKDYMAYQFELVSAFFTQPVCDLTVDDIREEVFALHSLKPIFLQLASPRLDQGPFVLNHTDLRGANIIVDESLRIQGIVDWEFASTVPRQVFAPPSWITGHDSTKTNKKFHEEFRDVLDEKSRSNSAFSQLRQEWYGSPDAGEPEGVVQTDTAFCVAHVLRRPVDAADIFFDFLAKKTDEDRNATISDFFDNHESFASKVRHRAGQCERYTQFLKTNGLYETKLDKILAEAERLKKKWGW